MRYAAFLFAAALILWAASTASPVLACSGHGASVAAAINDFFSQQGENVSASSNNSGNNHVWVNNNGSNAEFDGGTSQTAATVLQDASNFIGASTNLQRNGRQGDTTTSWDYNG